MSGKPKSTTYERKRKRVSDVSEEEEVQEEIELLESWINFGKPDPGSYAQGVIDPSPSDAPVGRIDENSFSSYDACKWFTQLPISHKTKNGLKKANYTKMMTDIQRGSLPHALCGRDIYGIVKTGSGKTLAFIVAILEKLYRARWGSENGVGSIIITPTGKQARQIVHVLKDVGKHHGFSVGLLIGGRKDDLEMEKERVNEFNILVCTPRRLLKHMANTSNFDCSQLQVLVLDEADRILDVASKKELRAIISQLPKHRQTLFFTETTANKSVRNLARLSLKRPELIIVPQDFFTPSSLMETAAIVSLDQKFDVLWGFIKGHLESKILVFLSTDKQVKFVFEAFKKLRPGIPLKCLHERMKQKRRMGIYSRFCAHWSVIFSTDIAARGLDFNKAADWVVQMDCPGDVATYIHRVGCIAPNQRGARSLLFLEPSEEEMLKKLQSANLRVRLTMLHGGEWMQSIAAPLAALYVKYPYLQQLARKAFVTYMRSLYEQGDKEVFDVAKLPIKEFSASMGLPMTPKVRVLNQKTKGKTTQKDVTLQEENDIGPQKPTLISCPQKDRIKSDVTGSRTLRSCDQGMVPKEEEEEEKGE